MLRSSDWLTRCRTVLAEFAREVQRCYPPEVIEAGEVRCEDRRGKVQSYPLLSLAIGLVHPDPAACAGHSDVSALAADAKREAKKNGGSALYLSSRRGPAGSEILSRSAA